MTSSEPDARRQPDRWEYHDEARLRAAAVSNAALGSFLRARRERLDPAALGLASLRRRRTPGLRREEVAEAAGISVEWLVKLEQGRAVAPPPATLAALTRALRLDDVDRTHLRRLAGGGAEPFVRERVPAGLRALVAGLAQPAYVTGRRWDLLAWNAAAREVFGDVAALPPARRDILLYVLTDPGARALFGPGWAVEARRMVALFRATFDLFADDPAFLSLVSEICAGCPAFEGWWRDHDVRAPVSGSKTLHGAAGARRYGYATFQCNDDPALKLAIYASS